MKQNDNSVIIDKVTSFIESHRMIEPGDGVVIGLSGGADSVCLLFLLCRLREKYALRLKAVHVNHGIRQEAGDDAAYAKEICRKLGVDIEVVCEDVPKKAAEWGMSEEEAGRTVRYKTFERIAAECGFNKVAVAHNMNDNAETVLFHMFRGSGLHGLTGIPTVRTLGGIEIIRPILCLERSEIEKVLQNEGISWVTDRTNLEDEYSRNRIRHNILPVAEDIAPGAVAHICESAASLSETEELLFSLEKECYEESVSKLSTDKFSTDKVSVDKPETTDKNGVPECEFTISVQKILEFHRVIIKRTILSVLGEAAGGKKDIGSLQVDQVVELIEKPGNRSIDLAKELSAERSYDNIVIKNKKVFEKTEKSETEKISDISITYMKSDEISGGINELLSMVNAGTEENIANKYTKWLDYDKIDKRLVVRTRQPGDYIFLSGADGNIIRKSLKDYMINCKIPAGLRNSIPVVADGNHCVWLVGYRISEACKLSENTVNIVRLQQLSSESRSKNS